MKAYFNHIFLNLGVIISAFYYMLIPPQYTNHNKDQINELSSNGVFYWFRFGLKN